MLKEYVDLHKNDTDILLLVATCSIALLQGPARNHCYRWSIKDIGRKTKRCLVLVDLQHFRKHPNRNKRVLPAKSHPYKLRKRN